MRQDPWRFPRPDAATHYADLLADAPRRPLVVFGPRQIGKTHFLTLAKTAKARCWPRSSPSCAGFCPMSPCC